MQLVGDFVEEVGGDAEGFARGEGAFNWVGKILVVEDGIVLDEAEVEAVVLGGDLLARVAVPALVLYGVAVGGFIGGDEAGEVVLAQGVRLAEGGHVRAQVVEPDFVRVPLVARTARKEEDVRLDALCVEDAGRQA